MCPEILKPESKVERLYPYTYESGHFLNPDNFVSCMNGVRIRCRIRNTITIMY